MIAGSAGHDRLRRRGGSAAAANEGIPRRRRSARRLGAGRRSSGRPGASGVTTVAKEATIAFPAILAASLTLIEEQEDAVEAREDARGAVIGRCALALFAAALTLGNLSGAVALLLATGAWFAGAPIGYLVAWFR
jgi:hypothetical protein